MHHKIVDEHHDESFAGHFSKKMCKRIGRYFYLAQCLMDIIWCHGVPNRIIHDRAPEFLSDVLQETAHLLGISQLPTSGGRPQSNGLVEHFNRTLKQMLAKVVSSRGHN